MDFMNVNYDRVQLCTIRKINFTVGIYNNCLDKWTVKGSNLVSMKEVQYPRCLNPARRALKTLAFPLKGISNQSSVHS